jgi:hypothetical protein
MDKSLDMLFSSSLIPLRSSSYFHIWRRPIFRVMESAAPFAHVAGAARRGGISGAMGGPDETRRSTFMGQSGALFLDEWNQSAYRR